MSIRFEPDPEEQRRQGEAHLLMLRVGLALIDDARRRGGFETDEQKLAARATELAPAGTVILTPVDADRILLSVEYSESTSVEAKLRKDGVLLEQGVGMTTIAVSLDEAELSPQELAEMERTREEFEARFSQPQFTGERFLRAVAAEPRPGNEVQVLAAELFADGVVVNYTFNCEPEPLAQEPLALGDFFDHELQIEDDAGTEYRESGGGGGGVQVTHSSRAFTPAVPTEARLLRIVTRSGSVELPL